MNPKDMAPVAEPQAISAPGGIPRPENNKYYPALDGLRAIAVLFVFFGHYEAVLYPRLSWGWAGVDLFFALSGFLITGILYDTQASATRLRDFFMRRILRIFPLYFGVLLVAAAFTFKYHWLWNPAWILWFTYLGNYADMIYLHSNLLALQAVDHLRSQRPNHSVFILYTGHFWSLCVEEQFYLFWPLVVFAVSKRATLRNICLIIIAIDLVARIVCVHLLPADLLSSGFLERFTPLRLDALLFGALAALLMRGPNAGRVQSIARAAAPLGLLAFVGWDVCYALVTAGHHLYQPDMTSPVLTTIGFTLIDALSAIIVLALLRSGGILYRALTLPPLRRLGQISYGFYVFHDLFHNVYGRWARQILTEREPWVHITAAFAFISTLIIATISYQFYEKPFLRLKRLFSASSPGGHAELDAPRLSTLEPVEAAAPR